MNISDDDVFGSALEAYFNGEKDARLTVESDDVETDQWPLAEFFHSWEQMGDIERRALTLARGRILDVGAGSGCHTLWLQSHGADAEALDVSDGAVRVMTAGGVKSVHKADFFLFEPPRPYDTILMLMNGTGLAGSLQGLEALLAKAKALLAPGGQLLVDSSDLIYLFEDEDGSVCLPIGGKYYGELTYTYSFRGRRSRPFGWLFADQQTLADAAARAGLGFEVVAEGDHYDYLARLTRAE